MFAELCGCSCFSFLRGAARPEEMVVRAKELELGALALCDRDGLYGSVRAHVQARELGVRAIVGAELTLDEAAAGEIGSERGWRATSSSAGPQPERPTLILLVEEHRGYENLCRLLTLAHADRPKGESGLYLEDLARHHQGLWAVVPAPRVPGDETTPPPALLATLKDCFGERAKLAVHRHADGLDAERTREVCSQARRYGFEIVASARPLFHQRSRKLLADVMYCIRNGTTLDRAGSALSSNSEAYLRSELQMLRLFSDHPEWVEHAGEVGAGLHFSLSELRYQFPCELAPGDTADAKLARLSWQGAERRYPGGVPEAVRIQIEKELVLIEKLGVAPYFLSTWEVVEMARRRRILCQGRGSAANSAVCYVLGITAVDPARSKLLFERFMSAERSEPPDIDVDFEHERREEVIQEIYQRHGRERAAMVSEVICYRGKSALRETGKAFGLSLDQVDRLSSIITHWDSAEVSDARLREAGFDVSDGRLRKLLMLARLLEGMPRHLSIHVGGFVLSATPLYHVAPVEPARMENRSVVPWDKDDLEALGFFKIDVLGLGMLTAIRKCLELIHAGGGLSTPLDLAGRGEMPEPGCGIAQSTVRESFDPLEIITRVPPEDPEVYRMISRADTVGVFQIESRAQMSMLPRLRPQRFYDLVVEVAIVRPGPIQGGMVHPYLRRRNGEEAVTVPHPDLWPTLERTLGVPLFQEQVMQLAIVGAGYSGGEADQLRRDMAAWRKTGKLLKHRDRLIGGFVQKGIRREFGEALFEQIKGFGEYGFPESHAASFALLVYTSSWQKRHYPAHFTCALLNSQPMGFYSPSALIQDGQRHGVEVRDVCIQHSHWNSSLEAVSEASRIDSAAPGADRALRLGFRLVRGLSEATGQRIVAVRQERPFSDLPDLVYRTQLHKDELELLAEAGALELLVGGRRQALWQARAPRTPGLFAGLSVREPKVKLPELRPVEQLLLDYERKGLSVADHPMCHLRQRMREHGVLTSAELFKRPRGERVRVAGLVTCRQQPGTASGVVFITLEDETGNANLIVYRDVFERLRLVARHSRLLLAHGTVERQQGTGAQKHANKGFDLSFDSSNARPDLVPELAPQEVPIVHLIVEDLERLDVPGRSVPKMSRDFH